jgi:hypothetical protein
MRATPTPSAALSQPSVAEEAIPVEALVPASAPQAAAAPSATVPTVEEALKTLVEVFHDRCCHGGSGGWAACRNPECAAVQQVLK